MNTLRRIACIAAASAAVAAAWPAQAAGPYTIRGGGGQAASTGGFVMSAARGPACNASVTQHPGQGVDSQTLGASGFAGKRVNLNWNAEDDRGGLEVAFYDGACNMAITAGQSTYSANPGVWNFLVPAEARWIVVTSSYAFNVTFSINLAP